jgi:hypothetical protein
MVFCDEDCGRCQILTAVILFWIDICFLVLGVGGCNMQSSDHCNLTANWSTFVGFIGLVMMASLGIIYIWVVGWRDEGGCCTSKRPPPAKVQSNTNHRACAWISVIFCGLFGGICLIITCSMLASDWPISTPLVNAWFTLAFLMGLPGCMIVLFRRYNCQCHIRRSQIAPEPQIIVVPAAH